MTRRPPLSSSAALLSLLLLVLVTGPGPLSAQEETSPEETTPTLREVPSVKVCMVNDMLFARDQIPVEVEGKTYYGCCEMCKERLARDSEIRQAVDPLTGETVDKATAIKAADAEGAILYFASAENLEKYQRKLESSEGP